MKLFTLPYTLRSAALASMIVLGACSKKDDDTPTPATTYSSTWTVDSKNYTATTSSGQVNNSMMALSLTQATSSSESYSIVMSVPAATGTYSLASGSNIGAYSTMASGTSASYLGSAGTVTVTTYSTTEIIGTFTMTASTISSPAVTKTITNGKFAIKR
ncbi:MAG: hypothetical protein ACRYFX_21505 [Janthinobacterium lividum]